MHHTVALPKGRSQYRSLQPKKRGVVAGAGGGGEVSCLQEETVMEVDVNDSWITA